MRHLALTLFLILLMSCSQNRTTNNFINSSEKDSMSQSGDVQVGSNSLENTNANISKGKIDLDSILLQKHNEYFASIEDSTLSMCCYQIFNIIPSIDFTRFNKTTEKYLLDNQTHTVDVYFHESSFIKRFYNSHPEVIHQDLVCGRIQNKELIANDLIQIGMTKSQFFNIFFRPTELIKQLTRLDIYENELGESFTSYRFMNDTLKEIIFDSDYDWIDKKFKNVILPIGH